MPPMTTTKKTGLRQTPPSLEGGQLSLELHPGLPKPRGPPAAGGIHPGHQGPTLHLNMLPEMAPGRQGPAGAHFLGNGREHGGGGWWVGGSAARGEDGKVWEMQLHDV